MMKTDCRDRFEHHYMGAISHLESKSYRSVVPCLRGCQEVLSMINYDTDEELYDELDEKFNDALERLRSVIAEDDSDWWFVHHFSWDA